MSEIDKKRSPSDINKQYANANPVEEQAPERESDSGSNVASQAHGDLAADATAYLERSGYTLEGIGRDPQEIERQAASLINWAREKNLLLTENYTVHLFRHNSTTAEHQVFYREADSRAVKLTHPGTFGVTPDPKGAQRAATPLRTVYGLRAQAWGPSPACQNREHVRDSTCSFYQRSHTSTRTYCGGSGAGCDQFCTG